MHKFIATINAATPISISGYTIYSADLTPPTNWPGRADADLVFSHNCLNSSQELDNPNNNVAMHFITATGTKSALESATSTREYYLINDTYYYRLTRRQVLVDSANDTTKSRVKPSRCGYSRVISGRLHIPLRRCVHLNSPKLKPLVDQAIQNFAPRPRR